MKDKTAAVTVTAFIEPSRMMADGLPYPDVAASMTDVEQLEQWCEFWEARGRAYEALGDDALAIGLERSAGEHLWLACLCHHYGQHMAFAAPALREAGQREKVRLYDRAAPHLSPPARRVELTVDGITIPGFLRLPAAATTARVPWVVLIGGLESTKEESCLVENRFLEQGVATFAFDGPGQGEVRFERALAPDFETYTTAIVDHFADHPRLDPARVGILGRSLGGHYAVRAVAFDERFRAAVCWGGCYDMSDFDRWPELVREGFAYVADRSVEEARRFLLETHTLEGVAERVSTPTLVVHGAQDHIFSMRQVQLLADGLGAHAQLVVEPDGNHCCHNRAHVVRPRMVEWLVNALKD